MELIHQETCFRLNYRRKDNISEMEGTLHNLTHEKIKKYVFMLLSKDFCSNFFVDFLSN